MTANAANRLHVIAPATAEVARSQTRLPGTARVHWRGARRTVLGQAAFPLRATPAA